MTLSTSSFVLELHVCVPSAGAMIRWLTDGSPLHTTFLYQPRTVPPEPEATSATLLPEAVPELSHPKSPPTLTPVIEVLAEEYTAVKRFGLRALHLSLIHI